MATNKNILCFGEVLIRYSPDTQGDWLQKNQVTTYIGGAEGNVATALAIWQQNSAYATVVPKHHLAAQILQYFEAKKVDTSRTIFRSEKERIGAFFLPTGTDMKNGGTIYDRSYSSFQLVESSDIDWEALLIDIQYLHITAITPALNQNLADITLQLVKEARKRNIHISFDLNFRPQLWKYGKSPLDVIPEIVSHCDLLMGNIWAAQKMLNIDIEQDKITTTDKTSLVDKAKEVSELIVNQFPQIKTVANTFRMDEAHGGLSYFATIWHNGDFAFAPTQATDSVVDKVGSGDCFMAGILDGVIRKKSTKEIVTFAAAAAFGKLFIKGDCTHQDYATIHNNVIELLKSETK